MLKSIFNYLLIFGSVLLLSLPMQVVADTVINDDLVVTGGTCAGSDCNNGENFAGNELVLKENNTRVVFGSPEGGPGQFRLTANSNINGGRNEFRIDQIQAPASTTVSLQMVSGAIIRSSDVVVQGDGSLHVTLSSAQLSEVVSTSKVERVVTYTPGQIVVIPAGSYTPLGPNFYLYDLTGPVVPAGGGTVFAATETKAVSAVTFSGDGNMVTLGSGTDYVAGAVSVGAIGQEQLVQEVDDGTQAADLANLGQLNSVIMPTPSAIPSLAANAIRSLGTGLSENIAAQAVRLDRVSARTAAMSALQSNPRAQGPLSVSFGVGTFEGETAAAMGVLMKTSNNSNFRIMLAGSDKSSLQTALSFKIVW